MARIDYVNAETASERSLQVLEKNRHLNIFRMLAHSESHFVNYCRLGYAIRHKGELDPQLRELAITRTGILCGSQYEVIAHKRIGRGTGLTAEKIDAIEEGAEASVFTNTERAVLRFTDAVVQTARPTDALFDAVNALLSPAALVELHLAIGYYIMTSKFLCAFDIDLQSEAT